jgi:endonuclease G
MAKFRSNHHIQSGSTIIRVGLFAAIAGGLFYLFNLFAGKEMPAWKEDSSRTDPVITEEYYYLPSSTTGQVIEHRYFTLSYSEEHEQAEWVAYVLKGEEVSMPWVERPDYFNADPKVKTGSSEWADYKNSGYDRGHLIPAADRAFSEEAIEETFFMSNISPQSRNFNKGIWRELEETTRSWAKKYKKLYVVTGPVLTDGGKGTIGQNNEITIPTAFYKVLLDLSEPGMKGIGFVIPNEISYEPLYQYAVSIDEVEERTGINFYEELMERDLEAELESDFNIDLWEFNKAKYDLRIKKWNQ